MRTDRKLVVRVAGGVALVAALAAVVAVFAGSSQAGAKKTGVNTSVSGSVSFWGIWAAEEQTAFKSDQWLHQEVPERQGHLHVQGQRHAHGAGDGDRRRQSPDVADVASRA